MRSSNPFRAATAGLVAALVVGGCGETKCNTDTDCPLPQVCVEGACQMRAVDGATVDTIVTDTALDPTTELDVVDVDVVEDTPGEEVVVGPCTPEFVPNARAIWGTTSSAGDGQDDPDKPQITLVGDDEVWIQSRIVTEHDATDLEKLLHRKIRPSTANAASIAYASIDTIDELDRDHAMTGLGSTMVTVFADVPGFLGNQMVWQIQTDLTDAGTVTRAGFSNSDANSSGPAVAAAETRFVAVWRQDDGATGNSTLRFGIVDQTGTEVATGTAAGDDTTDIGQPALAYSGSGYGLAYVVHAGAGSDEVAFVELDADGVAVDGTQQSWTVTEPTSVIPQGADRTDGDPSYPALVWNGEQYLLMYEEASATATAEDPSHLHVKILEPGGTITAETTVEDDVAAEASLSVSGLQEGMFDVTWNGERYGVVWVHADLDKNATNIWFFELSPSGELAVSSGLPANLNATGTQSYHPAIAWVETEEIVYYVYIWDEFRAGTPPVHVTYTYSYGCEIE
jgi:hypothetical protein